MIGDLSKPGYWQEIAATARLVIHLAQPEVFGARLTRKRINSFRDERLVMDRRLLSCLRPGVVERVVYVGGTSYYGDLCGEMRDETAPPRTVGLGASIAPAIEALPGYIRQGLPIVEAYPGGVYGPGSWFEEYVLEPLRKGKPIVYIAGHHHKVTYIHVEDCARALLHLLERGSVGTRYFVVDDRPEESLELSKRAAHTLRPGAGVTVLALA